MALTNEDLLAISNLLQPIRDDIQELKSDVRTLTIKQIAEDHRDLSRKLDEALRVENEREMLVIRLNTLENEMRKIEERLDQTA